MDAVLQGLNEAQTTAVCHTANVLQVLAPPGSGKTKTLTSRVGYLISHRGVQPQDVIVCTFTVKAASEMQARIAGYLGSGIARKLILGTFHSVARSFLAKWGSKIGLSPKFGIADSSETKAIIKTILKRLDLDDDANAPKNASDPDERLTPKKARGRISSLKAQGITAEHFTNIADTPFKHTVALVYTEYQDHLQRSNLLDFDDLLWKCVDLLRDHPSCVHGIEAVLIDEFQDTSTMQYQLMTLFAQHNRTITIVGDPDQSIYGWRNAEIRNLTTMRVHFPDTCIVNLEKNYRSSGAILLAAQQVIEQDKARHQKRLIPTHSIGLNPVLRRLPSSEDEAEWIVSEIKRSCALFGGLLKHSDYAILLRVARLSGRIESALVRESIPYRMVGGNRFFERSEVKLVLDYLRVIGNPDHTEALIRILNVPRRGIGDVSMQNLLEEARRRRMTLWNLILDLSRGRLRLEKPLSKEADQGVTSFINVIVTAWNKLTKPPSDWTSIGDFLISLIYSMNLDDYWKNLKPTDKFESRWENIEELVAVAAEYSASTRLEILQELENQGIDDTEAQEAKILEGALARFLDNVALSTASYKGEGSNKDKHQVTISTIHAAKGLEWPVVFIPSAVDGLIPISKSEDKDEERRLLYVAMTRAQALLYISSPKKDFRGDTSVSRFLEHEHVQRFFTNQGPEFTFPITGELAGTLRRSAPTKAEIEKASRTLPSFEDTRWPINGSENHSVSTNRWRATAEIRDTDNQPTSSLHMTTSTMQNANYSVNSTTLSTAFVSASVLLASQRQNGNEAKQKQNPPKSPPKKRKAEQPTDSALGQRSLESYFGKRPC